MTVHAIFGGAGFGKTYRLMQMVAEHVARAPLTGHQRILALTFMHGSRIRLNERLRGVREIGSNFECMTVDGFAWRVVCRWQTLLLQLGIRIPQIGEFEETCTAAAVILEHTIAIKWIAATFRAVVIDEAQDLTPNRLRIVAALALQLDVFAAADEFQCLDEALRPNPACTWLNANARIENLELPRRTEVPELLEAAREVRAGHAPRPGGRFAVALTPNAAFAGSYLANYLTWSCQNQRAAVITPAAGTFAKSVLEWVATRRTKHGNGPHKIEWESSNKDIARTLMDHMALPATASLCDISRAAEGCGDPYIASTIHRWLDVQSRARGRTHVTREEVEAAAKQSLALRHKLGWSRQSGSRAMSAHGAKNREFENVVILWPAAIRASHDQLRRLFYNAITRAAARCLVLVQAKESMVNPPFA